MPTCTASSRLVSLRCARATQTSWLQNIYYSTANYMILWGGTCDQNRHDWGTSSMATWGRYHRERRSSTDDRFHSPTVAGRWVLDLKGIMKRYHPWRTTRWGVTARSPAMVMLHDTRFVECQWWNDGWTVKTAATWRSSAYMIPAPGGTKEDSRFRERDRHLRLVYEEEEFPRACPEQSCCVTGQGLNETVDSKSEVIDVASLLILAWTSVVRTECRTLLRENCRHFERLRS